MTLDLTGIPDEYAVLILHSAQAARVRDVLGVLADMANDSGMPVPEECANRLVNAALTVDAVEAHRLATQEITSWASSLAADLDVVGAFDGWIQDAHEAAPASPAEVMPPMTGKELKAIETMAREGHAADMAIMDSYDVVESAGQIKALDFTRRVAEVAIAQIAVRARASKKYRGLPYKDDEGNVRHVADFEEFCRVFLKKSYRRVQELVTNLHTLGPALYEAATQVGFKARDYAALKALPAEKQEIIKQALATEDREQVLELLKDLAEQHEAQREADAKALAEAKADLDAKDAVLAEKTKRNDKLATELEKLKRLPGDKSLELRLAREKDAVASIDATMVKALGAMAEHLQTLDTVLAADVSPHTREYACNSARMLCEHFADLLAKHGVDVDLQQIVRPEWTRDVAKAQLAGGEG